MEDTALEQSAIIITGMHRSGTSLTASLLQSAGINVGDRLMKATKANPKGYFEDLDFVEFHAGVLRSQGIDDAGWTKEKQIKVQPQYLDTARNLLLARQDKPVWGWKDPRTTLFLDFWQELIPHAKFIFVYRSPWEIVDSLFRRGERVFQRNPNFAVQQWQIYNQAIWDFSQRYPERCLLLDIKSAIANAPEVVDAVNNKFKLDLRSPEALYEPALFHSESQTHYRQATIAEYFPDAIDLYDRLQQQSDRQTTKPAIANKQIISSWILQDWHDVRHITNKKHQAQQELEATHAKLHDSQVEQAQTQHQLNSVAAELAQSKQYVDSLQQELEATHAKLHASQVEQAQTQHQLNLATPELAQTRQQLKYQQTELAQIKASEVAISQQAQEQSSQFQKQLQIAQMQTEQLKLLVTAMESSKFWRLRRWWFNFKQQINLKPIDSVYQNYLHNSQRILEPGNLLEPAAPPTDPDIPVGNDAVYQRWLQLNYPRSSDLKKLREASLNWTHQPLISVIVPVYNPESDFLRQAIASVQEQVYANWELCLADDCSTKPYVRKILEEYASQDDRIKVVFRTENGHICHTSNSALELATGEYVALLDHDDLLPPHALAKVVELVNEHPEADLIYSDEDKVDDSNVLQSPFFKPDWCPDSFLARMYTCHLGVYRRSLVEAVGNFRVGFEGSQDYDLVLRITEKTDRIYHIPDVLYHWRIHLESTAADSSAKPYAANAAKKALAEAIERRGEPGKITTQADRPGVYQIRYEIKEPKLVSIIIPTKDLADTLDVCLKSIFANTTYPNYEVVVIDNNSTEKKTAKCFEHWQKQQSDRFRAIPYHVPFNYSRINNYAVTQAKGDYLLFLNNDIEVITKGWLTAMVEQAQRPSIGAVGSLLLYPDDTIQHAGVVIGLGGVAGHSHKHLHVSQPGYMFQVASTNNYSAVTGACLMCRREVFAEVGGLEADLAIAFNDVDFCLKIAAAGYRNIYLPHVVLYHYESKSRGYEDTPEKQARFVQEMNYMKRKWQEVCLHDPCYNPNLTKNYENYAIDV